MIDYKLILKVGENVIEIAKADDEYLIYKPGFFANVIKNNSLAGSDIWLRVEDCRKYWWQFWKKPKIINEFQVL